MKIGILSLKYYCNYGGILQSVALQEYLSAFGHEVEIVNFERTRKENIVWLMLNRILSFVFSRNILSVIKDRRMESNKHVGINSKELIANCERFMASHLNRSVLLDEISLQEYCKKFDCIVVGSDQVWSVTMSSFLPYFLDWDVKCIRVAYSACSVNPKPAFFNRLKIDRLLHEFDYISVRDKLTQDFVSKISGINPQITADPTLLYDFEKIKDKKLYEGPYIFMYILGEEINGGNVQAIKQIKKLLGNDIKAVSVIIPSNTLAGKEGADIVLEDCAPDDWVNLIKNAAFVYTDSFHGCIFSIKYNKPFIGYYKFEKRATRLLDLKERYGLNNIIDNIYDVETAFLGASNKDVAAIEKHMDISKKLH